MLLHFHPPLHLSGVNAKLSFVCERRRPEVAGAFGGAQVEQVWARMVQFGCQFRRRCEPASQFGAADWNQIALLRALIRVTVVNQTEATRWR